MPSYNRVILMGNLTRDPEMRYLPSNTPVTQIGVAVNERWKNRESGEWQERTNFIDCEAFARTAENINRFFHKGRPILIEGKLRLDQWEDQQGNKRSKLKVVIDSFEFVGPREEGGGGGGPSGAGGPRRQEYDSGDRDGPQPSAAPGPGHEPVEDDDIPF